jgi:hypothetical protein
MYMISIHATFRIAHTDFLQRHSGINLAIRNRTSTSMLMAQSLIRQHPVSDGTIYLLSPFNSPAA